MSQQHELSNEQWCVLDLLNEAARRGSPELHRREILHNANLPQHAAVKLTFAALTMPKELVEWTGPDTFKATERGLAVFRFKNGDGPSPVAGDVICLPDMSGSRA